MLLLSLFALGSGQERIGVQVRDQAETWERRAAQDLAHYISQILGRKVTLSPQASENCDLQFVVGEAVFQERPELRKKLDTVLKENPLLNNDGIVSEKIGSRIYLAGSNDDSHYYAVSRFLQLQGVRWYTPTSFGECVPTRSELTLDRVNFVYAPPFEVRNYWISWNGDRTDYESFAHRNYFKTRRHLVGSHQLGNLLRKNGLTEQLVLSDPKTASKVADLLQQQHAEGKPISLGISDAVQRLSDPTDLKLAGGFADKFFVHNAVADAYLPFYNSVIEQLRQRNPESPSLFSFLAYTSLTLPPQRRFRADPSLVAFLAPIDIDPNHPLNDPRSPAKNDLFGALKRWVKVMQGRVIIYDYDQGMLVWRDLPNPSHPVVAQDVKLYRELGILGFSTESRNALATTFTNLFFRGQLYWNPDLNVEAELQLFYRNFYPQCAESMADYWSALYQAWEDTDIVDHEFFVANIVYTPELVARLEGYLEPLRQSNPTQATARLRKDFTLKSFALIKLYTEMTEAASGQADYERAAQRGRQALLVREELSDLHPAFTTHRQFKENGPAFWPGEVAYFEQLAQLKKVKNTPFRWYFKKDPADHGIWQNWGSVTDFQDWQSVEVDRLYRHQGVSQPDDHGEYVWYGCQLEVSRSEAKKKLALVFPGIFNSSWLYINGDLIDHRQQKELWWSNDYRFLWQAEITGALKPGSNTILVRTQMKQHPSGIFRRPFLAETSEASEH